MEAWATQTRSTASVQGKERMMVLAWARGPKQMQKKKPCSWRSWLTREHQQAKTGTRTETQTPARTGAAAMMRMKQAAAAESAGAGSLRQLPPLQQATLEVTLSAGTRSRA
jgi:hypothetical protein